MRTFKFLCVCICLASSLAKAQERPTLLNTNDPRPDILPRPFYDNHTEYRARYNRPRFWSGLLAYEMSRTSQEAMVWKENYCAGNYDQHHMPPVYKTYYYPKPWEALNVAARPNFVSNKPTTQRVPGLIENPEMDESSSPKSKSEAVKAPSEAKADVEATDPTKSDENANDAKKPEVVPSPSDKTSSRATSKPRPVTTKSRAKQGS